MKRKLKIGIFIDHDIMIRHFIHSEVFKLLIKNHNVDIILPPEGHKRITLNPKKFIEGAKTIRIKVDTKNKQLWLRLAQVMVMRPRFDKESLDLRRTWRLVTPWKAEILHTFLGLPIIYFIYRQLTKLRARANDLPLRKLLEEKNYDLVINPGLPNGLFINDLIAESKRLRMPLIYIMNSWDNPSTAPFASGQPSLFLAWGQQTANHANIYQKIPKHKILKFGAAQFEIYKTTPKIGKKEFYKRHDINLDKKILLYAGGSLGTNEFEDLMLFENAIERGKFESLNVIYRPHPWGGSGYGRERIYEHNWKHIKLESTMTTYLKSLKEKGYHLTFPDYSDTHVVLSHVDYVISPLSTILIEAGLHGKPIMCFLPLEDIEAKHFQRVYNLPHFREFQYNKKVILSKNRKELIEKIEFLIKKSKDPNFKYDIQKTCEYFVSKHSESYDIRILKLVNKCFQNINK